MFTKYINDITDIIKSQILIFADDIKIYREINSEHDSEDLQNDLNNVSEWCKINKLDLNIHKCHVISFDEPSSIQFTNTYKIDNHELSRKNSVIDLGVTFNSPLSFADHITSLIATAS